MILRNAEAYFIKEVKIGATSTTLPSGVAPSHDVSYHELLDIVHPFDLGLLPSIDLCPFSLLDAYLFFFLGEAKQLLILFSLSVKFSVLSLNLLFLLLLLCRLLLDFWGHTEEIQLFKSLFVHRTYC